MTQNSAELPRQIPASRPDAEVMLQRILTTLEKDRLRGRLELVIAIILSLATLGSTWCGYQASLWGGVQGTKQTAADSAERLAAEDTIVGLQLRTFDVLEVREYWSATRQKDAETRDTVLRHMRPQLRKAVEASLAAGILENPDVEGPLERPEYFLLEEINAKRLKLDASQFHTEAQAAWKASGNYVSLTLMFASVLFFGGITGTFTLRPVRVGLGSVAFALFIVTMAMLIGLPVCKG